MPTGESRHSMWNGHGPAAAKLSYSRVKAADDRPPQRSIIPTDGIGPSRGRSFTHGRPLRRSISPSVVQCSLVRRHDHLADRPKRDAGELEMRPGKWNSDDRHGKKNRHDDMAERQPPPRQYQPYDVSQNPKQPGADVLLAGIVGARNRFLAEWQQRVHGDVERSLRPGDPDNGDYHDDGCDDPAERHPQTAAHDPCYVEQKGKDGHSPAPHTCPRSECRYRNRRLPAPNEVAPALAPRGQPCNRRRAGA